MFALFNVIHVGMIAEAVSGTFHGDNDGHHS
jgi:hypothetical protein